MVANMKIMDAIYKIDQFILELLKDFNEGIFELKNKIINYLVPMSYLWGFLVLLYQIFEYLRLGVWKQMSPSTEGFSINSSFIGFDKIANYLLDIHPIFSLPIISFLVIYFIYFLSKIILLIVNSSYILLKELLSFWNKEKKL